MRDAGQENDAAATRDSHQDVRYLRIAIPTVIGNVSPRFGYRREWAIFDVDQNRKEIVQTSVSRMPLGTSSALPVRLRELGIDVVLAVGMSERTQHSIVKQGIEVLLAATGEAPQRLVCDYLFGTLTSQNRLRRP